MDKKLKRRYNLCHRLRKKGVQVVTDRHAIEVTEQEYNDLGRTAGRYVEELRSTYHFVVQLRIPDAQEA